MHFVNITLLAIEKKKKKKKKKKEAKTTTTKPPQKTIGQMKRKHPVLIKAIFLQSIHNNKKAKCAQIFSMKIFL